MQTVMVEWGFKLLTFRAAGEWFTAWPDEQTVVFTAGGRVEELEFVAVLSAR